MGVSKRKRKKKPYQAEIFVAGTRIASRCFETQSAAWAWHEAEKKRWESGRHWYGEMTVREVVGKYKDSEVFLSLAPTSKRALLTRFELLDEAPFASLRMAEVDSSAIDRLLEWLTRHKTALSPSRTSFRRELKALAVVLNYFHDYFDEGFSKPITKRHWKRARYKTVVPRRPDYFIPAPDVQRWLEALRLQQDRVYYRLAVVQTVMGLRVGEASALTWDAIDFDRHKMEIRRTMQWKDETGRNTRDPADRTKTRSSRRTLPMPFLVEKILREARDAHPLSTMVFRTKRGEMLAYNSIWGAYRRAFKKAGLPWSGSHITRHTNGTLGLVAGGKSAVQVNLGHASDRETETYAKILAITENRVPEMVAALISEHEKINHVQNHVHGNGEGTLVNEIGRN